MVRTQRTILELSSFEGAHTLQLGMPEATKRVLGLEGRAENVARSRLVAELLGRGNLEFEPRISRPSTSTRYGRFDAVFCAGLLYHLEKPWRLINQTGTSATTSSSTRITGPGRRSRSRDIVAVGTKKAATPTR